MFWDTFGLFRKISRFSKITFWLLHDLCWVNRVFSWPFQQVPALILSVPWLFLNRSGCLMTHSRLFRNRTLLLCAVPRHKWTPYFLSRMRFYLFIWVFLFLFLQSAPGFRIDILFFVSVAGFFGSAEPGSWRMPCNISLCVFSSFLIPLSLSLSPLSSH